MYCPRLVWSHPFPPDPPDPPAQPVHLLRCCCLLLLLLLAAAATTTTTTTTTTSTTTTTTTTTTTPTPPTPPTPPTTTTTRLLLLHDYTWFDNRTSSLNHPGIERRPRRRPLTPGTGRCVFLLLRLLPSINTGTSLCTRLYTQNSAQKAGPFCSRSTENGPAFP